MPQIQLVEVSSIIIKSKLLKQPVGHPPGHGSCLRILFHTNGSSGGNQSCSNLEDPQRTFYIKMSSAGSSPKAVEEKGSSIKKEQGKKKKKKLYWVAKHGKIDIMQRGKDGQVRPLNWPKIQKDAERRTDESATIRHFQIETNRRPDPSATSRFQNDLKRGPDGSDTSSDYFYLRNQNKGHHHMIEESKGIESEIEDSDEDYEYLSSRELAEKLDRVERELLRIKDTPKAFTETYPLSTHHALTKERRREVSSRDITAKIDRLERELVRNEGTKKAFAEADTLPATYHAPTEECRRGESNHPASHPPGSQREQRQGKSKNHLGSQYAGSQVGLPETGVAERERRRGESIHSTSSRPGSHKSFREQSNHHPDPYIELAETERAERERFRWRSNGPTSPRPDSRIEASLHLDPPIMGPPAARGPKKKNRRRRGA